MALASVERLGFSYPGAAENAISEVSLELGEGEIVLLLGRSGSGKSTLLRAFSGLVPHFHGGRFSGSVSVAGQDTRLTSPATLAGVVATLFQDPEDQIVFDAVANEVAFGPQNLGSSTEQASARARRALAALGAAHLIERATRELSGGELQRVCLASALALDPLLLLLDEPTSQLDPEGARTFLELVEQLARERGTAVLLSEQRPALPLTICDRVLFLEAGRIVLDAPRDEAIRWLEREQPSFVEPLSSVVRRGARFGETVCRLEAIGYAYRPEVPVLTGASLEIRRGEIVALAGPNGCGKTTLAKLACGLLEPQEGDVELCGRAGYLSQDPGRYVVCERVEDEVALGLAGDLARARRWLEELGLGAYRRCHPRDLSSGERERLGLAAVLAIEPDLLILDEPTRGVDLERKRELAELLRASASERATLLVTHDLGFAAAVSDRIVTLAATPEPAHV
ncbi:MAG: ATP-binding cassette domain-containing protein [Gaiellaceae bacterium]|jgi:energy-coupling factor transport system ATP-binding protein